MKYIEKAQTQAAKSALKQIAKKHKSWDDAWRDRSSSTVDGLRDVKRSLANEQKHICCYCETEIDVGSSHSHIEHVRPRKSDPKLTFQYENLACSCHGRTGPDRHCGHLKGSDYDEASFVSPHSVRIRGLFEYDTDGGISASDNQRKPSADYMIQTLDLNCAQLVNMRKAHGQGLIQSTTGYQLEELRVIASYFLEPDNDGNLQSFHSLSRQFFGEIAEEILGERQDSV